MLSATTTSVPVLDTGSRWTLQETPLLKKPISRSLVDVKPKRSNVSSAVFRKYWKRFFGARMYGVLR